MESQYLDVVVADATSLERLIRISSPSMNGQQNHHSSSSGDGIFDAILTDPPYGFRESSRRIASTPVERLPSHVTPERLVSIMGKTRDV